jgi:hypothetical protein
MRAQNRANAEQSSEMAKQVEQLQKQMREREEELTQMRKRENWLVTEVVLARQLNGAGGEQQLDAQQRAQLSEKRMSMEELEKEIANRQLEGQQLTLAKALLKVKDELRGTKVIDNNTVFSRIAVGIEEVDKVILIFTILL